MIFTINRMRDYRLLAVSALFFPLVAQAQFLIVSEPAAEPPATIVEPVGNAVAAKKSVIEPSAKLTAEPAAVNLPLVLPSLGAAPARPEDTPASNVVPERLKGNVVQSAWDMTAGHTINQDLQGWAKQSGSWSIVWQLDRDWVIPSSTRFSGEFQDAVSDVIKTLSSNGALVRAHIYEWNHTIVITGPGVIEQ